MVAMVEVVAAVAATEAAAETAGDEDEVETEVASVVVVGVAAVGVEAVSVTAGVGAAEVQVVVGRLGMVVEPKVVAASRYAASSRCLLGAGQWSYQVNK